MTDKTPVDDLEGKKLDAAVAEEVMAGEEFDSVEFYESGRVEPWVIHEKEDGTKYGYCALPHYSTDIAAAWEVVEEVDFHPCGIGRKLDGNWRASFWVSDTPHSAEDDTAPEAICRAALKAVRADD